jgi:hypothetical protein
VPHHKEAILPSRGEKPPLRSNSKSQSCRSDRTMAGSFSASAASSACRGASLARRSLLPVRYLSNFRASVTLLQLSAMWRVCHVCGMGCKEKRMEDKIREELRVRKKATKQNSQRSSRMGLCYRLRRRAGKKISCQRRWCHPDKCTPKLICNLCVLCFSAFCRSCLRRGLVTWRGRTCVELPKTSFWRPLPQAE